MVNNRSQIAQQESYIDREAIRNELESTRAAFQAFLDSIDENQWQQRSSAGDWTVGEIMVHLTWALEQLPKEVASAKRGKGMFNMPQWLADPLSYWYTRWMTRNTSPKSIGQRYDAAMTAVLCTLNDIKEDEWKLGAPFYGHGFYTIADLFHTPAEHFAEHTADL